MPDVPAAVLEEVESALDAEAAAWVRAAAAEIKKSGPLREDFDPSKHPRDKSGKFIDAGEIRRGRNDPAKAKELLDKVTPKDRANLKRRLGLTGAGARKKQAAEELKAQMAARGDAALVGRPATAPATPNPHGVTPGSALWQGGMAEPPVNAPGAALPSALQPDASQPDDPAARAAAETAAQQHAKEIVAAALAAVDPEPETPAPTWKDKLRDELARRMVATGMILPPGATPKASGKPWSDEELQRRMRRARAASPAREGEEPDEYAGRLLEVVDAQGHDHDAEGKFTGPGAGAAKAAAKSHPVEAAHEALQHVARNLHVMDVADVRHAVDSALDKLSKADLVELSAKFGYNAKGDTKGQVLMRLHQHFERQKISAVRGDVIRGMAGEGDSDGH